MRDAADWSRLPRDLYVTSVKTDGIVFDVKCCSVPMAIGPEVRYTQTATAATDVAKDRVRHIVRNLASVNMTDEVAERQASRITCALEAAGLIAGEPQTLSTTEGGK
jgi:hypothetical protein